MRALKDRHPSVRAKADQPPPIDRLRHVFAAWAASRAASAGGCRFRVETGRALLESCGLDERLATPEQLPKPGAFDAAHRQWRLNVIEAAQGRGIKFTHGIAAKLIDVYLKARFVCGGYDAHERVRYLHPPIDSLLLAALGAKDVGGYAMQWRQAALRRWSKFDSDEYEQVIDLIRDAVGAEPLWTIEVHWPGNR